MSTNVPETSKPTPERGPQRVWWILFVLVLAWSTYLYFLGPRVRPGDLPEPSLKRPMTPGQADFRWTLATLDGEHVEFSQFQGKPIFLNLWASWCPPCVAEMPSIEKLAANPRLRGVQFVCVAIGDTSKAVRDFVDRHKMKVPVFEAIDSPPGPFFTEGIPATFLIDAEGRIVSQELGPAQWDHPSAVDFLEALAKTPADES